MGIDFYHMDGSTPCRAVLMTAKHLNIELNVRNVNLDEGEQFKPEFTKVCRNCDLNFTFNVTMQINPQHCVPTLVDNGIVLWESRAIMRYLVNQYAPGHSLYPNDPEKRAVVDRVLDFDLGSLFSFFGAFFYPQIFAGEKPNAGIEQVLREKLVFLDTSLAENKYVAGNALTLADLSVLSTVTTIEAGNVDISELKNVRKWMTRLESELPYYNEFVVEQIKLFKAWFNNRLTLLK